MGEIESKKRNLSVAMRIALAFGSAVFSTACANVTHMADGQPDILWQEDEVVREALAIRSERPARPLAYRAFSRCQYRGDYYAGAGARQYQFSMAATVIGEDRILLSTSIEGREGTILIGNLGELRDYNLWSPEHQTHMYSDGFGLGDGDRRDVMIFQRSTFRRDIIALLPHLITNAPDVGEVVAIVPDGENDNWARYVYRGLTRFEGRDAVVFDLIQTMPSGGAARDVLIGFNILSAETLAPLYQVVTVPGDPQRAQVVRCH